MTDHYIEKFTKKYGDDGAKRFFEIFEKIITGNSTLSLNNLIISY